MITQVDKINSIKYFKYKNNKSISGNLVLQRGSKDNLLKRTFSWDQDKTFSSLFPRSMERWYQKPTYYCQKKEEHILVLRNMHVVEIIFLQVIDWPLPTMDRKTHNCISTHLNFENFKPCLKCQLMKYIRL